MRDGGDAVVKGLLIPEVLFRAANAAMPGLDGKGNAVVPAGGGAGIVGGGAFAAHLVQAQAGARALVVPRFYKLARVKVGTAVALVRLRTRGRTFRAALLHQGSAGDMGDVVGQHGTQIDWA